MEKKKLEYIISSDQRKHRNLIVRNFRWFLLEIHIPLTLIYASNHRTQTTVRNSTMHWPTVPILSTWIRVHGQWFPKRLHKLKPWCWRTWKRKFFFSVFIFYFIYFFGYFLSTRESAADRVWKLTWTSSTWNMYEHLKEAKNKNARINFAISFFNQISLKTNCSVKPSQFSEAVHSHAFPNACSNSLKFSQRYLYCDISRALHSMPMSYIRAQHETQPK